MGILFLCVIWCVVGYIVVTQLDKKIFSYYGEHFPPLEWYHYLYRTPFWPFYGLAACCIWVYFNFIRMGNGMYED